MLNVKVTGRLKARVSAGRRPDKLEMNSVGETGVHASFQSGKSNGVRLTMARTPYTSPYIYITQAGDDMREIPTPGCISLSSLANA